VCSITEMAPLHVGRLLLISNLVVGTMPERWQEAHIFSACQAPGGGSLIATSCSDAALRFWTLQVTPPPPPHLNQYREEDVRM